MSSRIAAVSAVIVAIACASAAQGTPITFAFEGDITFVQDQFGLLGGQVGVGDTFSGAYTFESTTPDSDPGEPRRGFYVNALSALSGQINNVFFEAVPGFTSSITIEDGFLHPSLDVYSAIGNINVGGWTIGLSIGLFDNTGIALDMGGDSLPISPPNLAAFSSTRFTLASEPAGLLILGELTALVPEPTSLVILAFASMLLLRSREPLSQIMPIIHALSLLLFFLLPLLIGTSAKAADCNLNGVDDVQDIAVGTSSDCNLNAIPDECAVHECPLVEIVLLFDSSKSMLEGTTMDGPCTVLALAMSDLSQDGIQLAWEALDIGDDGACLAQYCCSESVSNTYGLRTPGMPPELGDCFYDDEVFEDWAAASAIVAGNRAWTPGSLRIIFPISDEGPRCGLPVYDPGNDREAIEWKQKTGKQKTGQV